MKRKFEILGVFIFSILSVSAQLNVMSDTWVCTDGLNRVVASSDKDVSRTTIDTSCVVGMFYYIWHGQHGPEIKDITRMLEADAQNPTWGYEGQFHWAGKPALGYYTAGDPFVIAKHMQMLMDAGVDFYFFDVTNGYTYDEQVKAVIKEIDRRQALGLKTPKLAFMTHSGSNNLVAHYYNNYYTNPAYNKYWFYWNGKPLILTNGDEYDALSDELKNSFTHRFSWAWDPGKNKWPWLENYPQKVNYTVDENGKEVDEQMSVSVAQHAHTKIGKSYSSGKEPYINEKGVTTSTPYGYYFKEQFVRAIALHPKLLMITQWNEWMAQRFVIDTDVEMNYIRPGITAKMGETYFIDVYNQEFSRDLEPSSESLIRDNYYMQLVSYMRQYKGVQKIPVPKVSKKIYLNQGFEQWDEVATEFLDEPGDVYYTSTAEDPVSLVRKSNDIVSAKITKDIDSMYFYVKVNDHFIPPTAEGQEYWMTLLLNTNSSYKDGWAGYDYMVSYEVGTDKMKLYKYNKTAAQWEEVKEVSYRKDDNRMMISVAKSDMAITKEVNIDFKWIDNMPKSQTDILYYLRDGEAAPNGRFNYRYKGARLTSVTPTGITVSVFNSQFNVYGNGESVNVTMPEGAKVRVYDVSGKCVLTASKNIQSKRLRKGTYIAECTYNGTKENKKFLVK